MKTPLFPRFGLALTTFTALGLNTSFPAIAGEFRSIDGTGNNPSNSTLGVAGTELIRLFDSAYQDDISEPRGGGFMTPATLPNARDISNAIANQTTSVPNYLNASDWIWQWGQFIDHDLDLNEDSDPSDPSSESFPIPVNDPTDPLSPGPLPFTRVPGVAGTGIPGVPREQGNQITSFIDASVIYGSDRVRAEALRTFNQGMLTSSTTTVNGREEILPMFNTPGLPNANPFHRSPEELFLSGDVRINENVTLTATHTLFFREHNRLAEEIYDRIDNPSDPLFQKFEDFQATNPGLTEEQAKDEFTYQTTRKMVGAQIQQITYNEFLPLLLGPEFTQVEGLGLGGGFGLDPYSGYNELIDPSIANEFANAAYRLGHTQLSNELQCINKSGTTTIFLGDAFFNPEFVSTNGADCLYLGLASQTAQAVDNFVVDGVRNFLFPAPTGGFDLAAVNIQRGRDVGLPAYVDVYEALGLGTINDFRDLPFAPAVSDLFDSIYTDVAQIDLWIGGISELPINGGLLGPTFNLIVSDQFWRLRNGDRFFYLNEDPDNNQLAHILAIEPDFLNTTLADIIRRNVSDDYVAANIPDNVFLTRSTPEPGTVISLLAFGGTGISVLLRQKLSPSS